MSFNLWARPVPADQPESVGLYALKHTVAKRFWGQDGSLRSDTVRLTVDMLDYLRGVRDGSVAETKEAAQALIDLLEANPQGVDLWIGESDDA